MRRTNQAGLAIGVLLGAACQPGGEGGDADPPEPVAAGGGEAEDEPGAAAPLEAEPELAQETAAEFMRRTQGERRDEPVPQSVAVRAACAVCHGEDAGGLPALGTPRVGGLEPWYIARQLAYFKQGIRGHSQADVYGRYMRGLAMTLETTEVIEDLAYHFAALDPEPVPPLVDGDVERGAELYVPCAACHGEDGSGNADLNTPTLIGQSGTYLLRQLEHYRRGIRGTHPLDIFGMQMVPVVESALESRQDSVDVVAFIQMLPEGAPVPADEGATGLAAEGEGAP